MKDIIDLFPKRKEYCLLVKSAFSSGFCEDIIKTYKESFKAAITHYPSSYRNNERQLLDNTALSKKVFNQVKNYIPHLIKVEGISEIESGEWRLDGLNDRIRICRYLPNQYFNKHLDGVHYLSEQKQSKLTFMIYLNGQEDFEGGRTLFFNSKEDDTIIGSYAAEQGDLIIFDHNLWHSGDLVLNGEKYILRSDIIYTKTENYSSQAKGFCAEGHLGYIWTANLFNHRLLTSGRDKKIKIWSEAGKKVGEIEAHKNSIVALLPFDEERFITASRDQSIKIWTQIEKDQFQLIETLMLHKGSVLALEKLNATEFLSAGADGLLNRIDINGNLIKSIHAHQEWIWGVKLIGNDHFITISEDGNLKVWSINNDQEVCSWQESMPLNSIAVQANTIYIGRFDGMILEFEFEQNQLKKNAEKKAHKGIIRKLLVQNALLFSASEDSSMKIWELEGLQQLRSIKHKNFVQDVLLWNQSIITVSYDGEIKRSPLILE